jgi:hypothetical protein
MVGGARQLILINGMLSILRSADQVVPSLHVHATVPNTHTRRAPMHDAVSRGQCSPPDTHGRVTK